MDFKKLSQTDVSKHVEKKGRFSYLSWPFAVAEFRKACPNGSWRIGHFDELKDHPYSITDSGCFVEVTVIPDMEKPEVSFTQVHPVLDNKNKTIKEPNAFDINTSIQRCLVKAIALATGIGLYIYAGEDLPPGEEERQIDQLDKDDAKLKKKMTEYENAIDASFKERGLDGLKNYWKAYATKMKKDVGEQHFKQLEELKDFHKKQAEKVDGNS